MPTSATTSAWSRSTSWPRTISKPACWTAPRPLFLKLEGTAYEQPALKFLLEIYEQEKDWQKAIEASQKLDSVAGHSSAKEIAHFYCEMAQAEMVHGRTEAARGILENALSVNRRCVRAHFLLGDLALSEGSPEEATEAWKRVEAQNPAYLTLVAEKLLAAHKQLGRADEGLALLRGYLDELSLPRPAQPRLPYRPGA